MSGFLKIKSKELLLNNNLKLLFVTFLSSFLRLLFCALVALFTHFSLISEFLKNLITSYNSLIVYFIYSLILVIIYLILFLFNSGIKLGEQAIYFMQSKGTNAKIKYLFIFLKPSQSFRAFYLYLKIFLYKFCWFIFLNSAPVFCLGLTLYLYFNSNIYLAVFYTLIAGTIILFSISRFFYNCFSCIYSFAPYYLCTNINISVNDAINKSRDFSDGFLKDGVYLKTSLFPWVLSCLLIFPIFYVIPFIKLTKAKYVTFSDGLHYALPNNYLLDNYLKLNLNNENN